MREKRIDQAETLEEKRKKNVSALTKREKFQSFVASHVSSCMSGPHPSCYPSRRRPSSSIILAARPSCPVQILPEKCPVENKVVIQVSSLSRSSYPLRSPCGVFLLVNPKTRGRVTEYNSKNKVVSRRNINQNKILVAECPAEQDCLAAAPVRAKGNWRLPASPFAEAAHIPCR